jgi:hypothetical protein
MSQRVDGHPPSDNSDKTRLREAPIMTENDEILMTNVEGMTKYEWQKPQSALLPVSHLSFVISFTSLPIGNFAIATG